MDGDAKTRRLDCGGTIDRLSNLPRNLMDLILGRLPLHDAARTSILSKTWRTVWKMHPQLVFDEVFISELVSKRVSMKDEHAQLSEVSRTITHILLTHSSPILKFHLSIPRDLPLHQSVVTDMWIKNISKRGVRILELCNKQATAYKMPSYLFSCLGLTDLSLTNCILCPPPRFGVFSNLINVNLADVKITDDIIFGTKLEQLILEDCTGIKHLGCLSKINNNLNTLEIVDSGEIDWQLFECTQKVQLKTLMLIGVTDSRMEGINLDKLVENMPNINALLLDFYLLESLEPGTPILKRLITTMEEVYLYYVEFYDFVQIQYVLSLIRCSPNLRFFYIGMERGIRSTDNMKLLDHKVFSVDMNLDHLETVHINGMAGSRTEFQLIKLILASAPSLRCIKLEEPMVNDPENISRISQELLQFPRASTAVQIIWT